LIEVVPFEPEHVEMFQNYGGQENLVHHFTPAQLLELKSSGFARSAISRGHVVGCSGLIELSKFRAVTWSLFEENRTNDLLAMFLRIRRYLRQCDYKRIESYIDPNRPLAIRWIQMLGFQLERPFIPYFFPDGSGAMAWVLYPEEKTHGIS
jgi:hypothetical protein